jgi:hypothetical protein
MNFVNCLGAMTDVVVSHSNQLKLRFSRRICRQIPGWAYGLLYEQAYQEDGKLLFLNGLLGKRDKQGESDTSFFAFRFRYLAVFSRLAMTIANATTDNFSLLLACESILISKKTAEDNINDI